MAVNQKIRRDYKPTIKDISYLGKTFPEFRQDLIEFAKSYYPNSYSDFNEASPGMMFIEMAAYMGDVLSFYIDNQFKENLITYAQERKNVLRIAQGFGYRPRLSAPATVEANIYQIVPALGTENNSDPDEKYFVTIKENSVFSSNTVPSVEFRSLNKVSFKESRGRNLSVFARDNTTGEPTYYLAEKTIKLTAGTVKTATYTFGTAEKFSRITLPEDDVISVISVSDSDGFDWTYVDFLGQDVVLEEKNISRRGIDGYNITGSMSTDDPLPARLAVFKRKPRRFTTRISENMKMEIWFGSGTQTAADEILKLDQSQIANSAYDQNVSNSALDPSDFLTSDTFGLAPSNTTITVTYLVGGGVESNVPSNTIINVDRVDIAENALQFASGTDRSAFNEVVESIAINNPFPARGGGDVESIEEIKQNTLAYFNAQNRIVTNEDFIVRTLSMPPQFGHISKAFVLRDEQLNKVQEAGNELEDVTVNGIFINTDGNPFNNRVYVDDPVQPNAINLYVLGRNSSGKLDTLNPLVKRNLAKYLEQFRMLTDEVNILDGFVVNIGVDFNIIVYKDYNLNDVLARSIDAVRDFFDIDYWQLNQPIILNDLQLAIGSVDGVRSVIDVSINNKYQFKHGRDYQNYRYSIQEATINGVVYPSLDPCIFEIRYPDTDIVGNASQ